MKTLGIEGLQRVRSTNKTAFPMILGLDIGDSRVGVASCEDSSGIATPLITLERANGAAEKELLRLIAVHSVKVLVAGLPLSEDGTRSPQCESVEKFCRRISKRVAVEVRFIDEYSSTAEAEERFRESRVGRSRKKSAQERHKGVIDALAAAIILQSYLDAQKRKAT